MKKIELTQNRFAQVDDADYEYINSFRWRFNGRYVSRQENGKTIYMHRQLIETDMPHIDHINGDGLDNRRDNLRPCTKSQNNQNRRPNSGKKYKGVYFRKDIGRWYAEIKLGSKRKRIGAFDTAEEGAIAYNEVAKEWFGNFAYLNEVS